ncbi:hypothetical protein JCM10207_006120 [Rhodosporidiobolus poonsookiae]
MKTATLFSAAAFLASAVLAHPGEAYPPRSPAEFEAHRLRARTASNCASHVAARKSRRLAKRAAQLKKRNIPTSVLSAASAQATGLLNTTCLTTPEAVEGPYFLRGDLLRTNIAEDQGGIPLTLDIGLIDINTCEPLTNNLIEVWHANATGSYSYFTTDSMDAPSGGMGGGGGNGTMPSGGMGGMSGAAPSGTGAAPSAAASGLTKRSDTDPYDDGTFLRGGYPTNDDGVVEFTSVYPGFYTGRTAHIHIMVRKDYEIADNGTIIATAGTIEHIGQLFFLEDLNNRVFSTSVYLDTTQTRTYNDDDSILQQDLSAGDWPFVDASLVGESIEDGIYGYITIGIDTNATTSITTENALTADDLDPEVQASAFAANGLLDYLSTSSVSGAAATGSTKTASGSVAAMGANAAASASATSGANRLCSTLFRFF